MCLCDIERMDRVCVDEGSIRCVDVFKLRLHLSIWVKVQKRFLASVSVRRSDRSTGSECLWFLTVRTRPSVSSCLGVSSPGALATTLNNASLPSSRQVSCMCLKLITVIKVGIILFCVYKSGRTHWWFQFCKNCIIIKPLTCWKTLPRHYGEIKCGRLASGATFS